MTIINQLKAELYKMSNYVVIYFYIITLTVKMTNWRNSLAYLLNVAFILFSCFSSILYLFIISILMVNLTHKKPMTQFLVV